jgi:TPR repeat protein
MKEGQIRSKILSSGNFSLKSLKNYLLTAIKGDLDASEMYQFQDLPGAKTAYLEVVKETTAEALFQLSTLYMKELKDVQKAERYYRMAVDAGHIEAAVQLGDFCNYTLQNYQKAEKYYLMAVENRNVDALVNLGLLYHGELKNPKKAEKYYLMAAEEGDLRAMNGLAWLYFEGKQEKQRSLYYIQQTLEKERNIYTAHTAACIYIWNDRPQEAFELAEEFIYAEEAYQTIARDILFYLILLLAKRHYPQVKTYFESPRMNLSERFNPVYYALLYLMNDPDYNKLPPELSEPVTDILSQVTQLAKDYH